MQHSCPLLFPHSISLPFFRRFCFMFHPHERSDVLNGLNFFFPSSMCTLNRLKSVFRSPVCCDHDKKVVSKLLKRRRKTINTSERSLSRPLLYQAMLGESAL